MDERQQGTITSAINAPDRARDGILPRVYSELRVIARRHLNGEKQHGGEFHTTHMVHEAFVRLMGKNPSGPWQSRAHFYGAAATAMRHILVDAARKRRVYARHARMNNLPRPEDRPIPGDEASVDLLALDEALAALEEQEPDLAKTVSLRFFGGLGIAETAEVMGISERTVKRNWSIARAWLYARMNPPAPRPSSPAPSTGEEASDRPQMNSA